MIDPRQPNFSSTPIAADRPRFLYRAAEPDTTDDGAPPTPPVVTVITPYFNTGEIFHETAACVLGQSLQRFEWIIINDRSTDPGALAVLDEYRPGGARNRSGDPRIRIIDHRANHGLSAARNTGFRAARAPYVFMLDSDDLIEPTTLEKCAWFLEANPEFAFVGGFNVGFGGQEYVWDRGFHNHAAMLDQNLATATKMLRTSIHARVGGFDETIRGGLEDWDFWLRCADHDHWGGTIPEYLDWYRRRAPMQYDAWANLKSAENHRCFRERLKRLYPRLFEGHFPYPSRQWHAPHADIPELMPWSNPLDSQARRLLMIIPWFRMGGADKFNLDLLRTMTERGWEVTIATTLAGHPWVPEFTRYTPDVFMLDHLAQLPHYPRLLRYLIDSRKPEVVMLTNSELGYLTLPYLRAHCPGPTYVDYNHMEEVYWKNGGHPRAAAGAQDQLELNIVASQHLKRWMVARGASPDRIEVCPTNVDSTLWKPDPELRDATRLELGIDPEVTVLLYPVRLTAQKQPMVFADTMRRLIDRAAGSRWLALVAGDGEDRPALERYMADNSLSDHVRLLGAVPITRMPALYAASDIFFLPSMQEGVALSIYEAMSMSLSVVGAIVGGQRELVVPGTGFLLPLNDDKAEEAETYARLLAQLIADPDQRATIGAAARLHVIQHHQLSKMAERIERIFGRAARLKHAAPRQTLTPAFAREVAITGIDWVRQRDLCDQLWPGHQRAMALEAERQHEHERALRAAEHALGYIERSTTWRLVQGCKNFPLYTLYARARYGREWARPESAADPADRLARIRASRSYRVITTIKRLPPANLITRMRHGTDHHRDIPELLRGD